MNAFTVAIVWAGAVGMFACLALIERHPGFALVAFVALALLTCIAGYLDADSAR